MSEAAIILAIANLIFSGIVIYMNMRQGKILSDIRKQEKLFDINLTTKLDRLNKARNLMLECYGVIQSAIVVSFTLMENEINNQSTTEAQTASYESYRQRQSEMQKGEILLLELETLTASLKDDKLTEHFKAYDDSLTKVLDKIVKDYQPDKNKIKSPLFERMYYDIFDESLKASQGFIERLYQIETEEKHQLFNTSRISLLSRFKQIQAIK